MDSTSRTRISRKLLILLGVTAFALAARTTTARPICECAPLDGQYCGANGVTYDSPCVAACQGVKIVHPGPC